VAWDETWWGKIQYRTVGFYHQVVKPWLCHHESEWFNFETISQEARFASDLTLSTDSRTTATCLLTHCLTGCSLNKVREQLLLLLIGSQKRRNYLSRVNKYHLSCFAQRPSGKKLPRRSRQPEQVGTSGRQCHLSTSNSVAPSATWYHNHTQELNWLCQLQEVYF